MQAEGYGRLQASDQDAHLDPLEVGPREVHAVHHGVGHVGALEVGVDGVRLQQGGYARQSSGRMIVNMY